VLAAWQIYRKIAFTLLRRLGGVRTWRCWLALSGQRIDRTSRVWPPGWHRVAQGEGDLGRRMVRVVRAMPPGPVVIVGSDIPSIGPDDVSRAFRVLHEKDLVFGPAMDGGYWLIGFKRRPIPPGLFSDVRWSTRNALVDTLANTGGHSVTFLDLLEDIDSGASLYRWRTGIVPRHAYRPMLDR
jgi:glycosyltransferase A (GT-A) superfamily protein (DUF2064 family)